MGAPPTGRRLTLTGTTTLRLAGGKITDHWFHYDHLAWMEQTGSSDLENTAKDLMRRFLEEGFNQGRCEVIDEIFSPEMKFQATAIHDVHTPADLKRFIAAERAAFPDIHYVILGEPLADRDRVAVRWRATGAHTGAEWMGIRASGARVSVEGVTGIRVSGGKIVEHWADWDALGLMQQMGVVPAIGQLASSMRA